MHGRCGLFQPFSGAAQGDAEAFYRRAAESGPPAGLARLCDGSVHPDAASQASGQAGVRRVQPMDVAQTLGDARVFVHELLLQIGVHARGGHVSMSKNVKHRLGPLLRFDA